jgi:hypothetical protein
MAGDWRSNHHGNITTQWMLCCVRMGRWCLFHEPLAVCSLPAENFVLVAFFGWLHAILASSQHNCTTDDLQ